MDGETGLFNLLLQYKPMALLKSRKATIYSRMDNMFMINRSACPTIPRPAIPSTQGIGVESATECSLTRGL